MAQEQIFANYRSSKRRHNGSNFQWLTTTLHAIGNLSGDQAVGQISAREQGSEEGSSPGQGREESRRQGGATGQETPRRQSWTQHGMAIEK